MPENDERSEKKTRTSIGVGNTGINRETTERDASSSAFDDRPSGGTGAGNPYRDDRYSSDRSAGYDRDRGAGYDDDDDYQERARRGARDLGDSVRDTGRTVRREGTDILTAGCDLIGGIFIGIGEAISPRRRGGSSSSACGDVSVCRTGSSNAPDDEGETTYRSRPRGGTQSGGSRVSTSRTEIRRTSSR